MIEWPNKTTIVLLITKNTTYNLNAEYHRPVCWPYQVRSLDLVPTPILTLLDAETELPLTNIKVAKRSWQVDGGCNFRPPDIYPL